MYVGVVHFNHPRDKFGRIASDGRPMASARRFTLGDKTIVIRARKWDDGFALRVTRNTLGGEVLYRGLVPDGQYTSVNDDHASFWVIVLSSTKLDVDASNKGVWTGERGSVPVEDPYTEYERKPEPDLRDLLAPTERDLPATREAIEINGDDIRYLCCTEGGVFDGWSHVETWYVPQEDCYRVRFWHTCNEPIGKPLSKEQAARVDVPERVSCNDMERLVATLMGLGLADIYSYYEDRSVCDGGSWELTIGTRDGYAWQWDGHNAYPHGWDEAYSAICQLLLGYRDSKPHGGQTTGAIEARERDGDGDEGRTEIAHFYRYGYILDKCAIDEIWVQDICLSIKQDLLLYRRTRRAVSDYVAINDELFAKIMGDIQNGNARRWTAGELLGALGYVVDHDDTQQTKLRALASNGSVRKLLCNERIREKAATELDVTGWEV